MGKITQIIDGVEIGGAGGGSAAIWGSITGNIQDQTDLQAALDAKLSVAISKTYAELATMIAGNELVVGQAYLLTDFATHYLIPESTDYHTGNTEQLLIIASSTNTFEVQAYSTNYPQDIIYYEFVDSSGYGGDKGRITYRLDTNLSISVFCDWRNVGYYRFTDTPQTAVFINSVETFSADGLTVTLPDGNPYGYFVNILIVKTSTTTVDITVDATTNSYTLAELSSDYEIKPGIFIRFSSFDINTYSVDIPATIWDSWSAKAYKTFAPMFATGGSFYNVNIGKRGAYDNNVFFGGELQSISIMDGENNTFFAGIYSLTAQHGFSRNVFYGEIYSSNLEGYFEDNKIDGEFGRNNVGANCGNNNITGICQYNNIGKGFSNNIFSAGLENNTFGINFQLNNVATVFSDNKIGNTFQENDLQDGFFQNNIISDNFYTNTMTGGHFQNNIIGKRCGWDGGNIFNGSFTRNTTGIDFYLNTFGSDCEANSFGDSFHDNNFGDLCSFNRFDYNTGWNNFGASFKRNVCAADFSWNNFGEEQSSDNIIGKGFDTNTINVGGFRDNTIGANVTYNYFDKDFHNNKVGDVFSQNSFGEGMANNIFTGFGGANDFAAFIAWNLFPQDLFNRTYPEGASQMTGIGDAAVTTGFNSMALGAASRAEGQGSSAIGAGAISQNKGSVSIDTNLIDIQRNGFAKIQVGKINSMELSGASGMDTDLMYWEEANFNSIFAGESFLDLTNPSDNGYTYFDYQVRTGDVLILWDFTNDQDYGEAPFRIVAHTATSITVDRDMPTATLGVNIGFRYNQVPLGIFASSSDNSDIQKDYIRWFDPITGLLNNEFVSPTPFADGTYTVGIGGTQNGTITIEKGIITNIQEAI